MSLSPVELVRNAEVLGRLATLAMTQEIDGSPLAEALTSLGAEPGQWATIAMDQTGLRLSAMCRWPADEVNLRGWAGDHGAVDLLDRAASLQADRKGRFVEFTQSGQGMEIAVRLMQRRDAAGLAALLGASGLDSTTAADLAERAEFLTASAGEPGAIAGVSVARDAAGEDTCSVHVARLVEPPAEATDSMARVLTLAEELGVTAAQRGLFERTFLILARGKRRCLITLDAAKDHVHKRVRVEHNHVPFEHVLRLFVGLYSTAGVADRLGALAGAFHAEQATTFEITFTTTEPPAARVGIETASR